MKFKVGDKVKVENWGLSYTTYTSFFKNRQNDSNMKIEYMINYAYNNDKFFKYYELNSDPDTYTVVYVNDVNNFLSQVLIQDSLGATYIIRADALEFKNKKMTLKEIEEQLGYSIELISEDERKNINDESEE